MWISTNGKTVGTLGIGPETPVPTGIDGVEELKEIGGIKIEAEAETVTAAPVETVTVVPVGTATVNGSAIEIEIGASNETARLLRKAHRGAERSVTTPLKATGSVKSPLDQTVLVLPDTTSELTRSDSSTNGNHATQKSPGKD